MIGQRKSIHAVLAGRWIVMQIGWFLAVSTALAQQQTTPPATDLGSGLVHSSVPPLTMIHVVSRLDSQPQPVSFWAPETATKSPTPLLVFLHSWSADWKQPNVAWRSEAAERGWIFLHPNFRGPNRTPQACGSKLARQDILDAIDEISRRYSVDSSRVYLAGTSGGGHMAMLMAGHHPDRFSAVTAWVGISDLSAWYQHHLKNGKPQRYAQMILDSLGAAPGTSVEVDDQYRDRSPLFHLQHATGLPLDIAAGINDGHSGSVPISHSLLAFNVIAKANEDPPISQQTIDRLRRRDWKAADVEQDPDWTRDIVFRRLSGKARVTIFQGGHEGLAEPACKWLSDQQRATVVTKLDSANE